MAPPSGVLATPLVWMTELPGPTASNRSAARSPAPEAPTWSPVRAIAMSTRPAAASIRGVKLVITPPWRMNVPSCTVRTRRMFGLKVIVSVSTERRDALFTDTGTVYGPPATWNVVPGGVRITCAGVGAGLSRPGGGAGGAVGSRGGTPVGVPPGGVVGAGGTPAGGAVAPGGVVAPG